MTWKSQLMDPDAIRESLKSLNNIDENCEAIMADLQARLRRVQTVISERKMDITCARFPAEAMRQVVRSGSLSENDLASFLVPTTKAVRHNLDPNEY
jgi:hypothetical protein